MEKFQYKRLDLDFLDQNKDTTDSFTNIYNYFSIDDMIEDQKSLNLLLEELYQLNNDVFKKEYNFDQYKSYLTKIKNSLSNNNNQKNEDINMAEHEDDDAFIETGYDGDEKELKILLDIQNNDKVLDAFLGKAYASQPDKFKQSFDLNKFKKSISANKDNCIKVLKHSILKEIYEQNRHLSLILDFKDLEALCDSIEFLVPLSDIDEKTDTSSKALKDCKDSILYKQIQTSSKALKDCQDSILYKKIQLLENFIDTETSSKALKDCQDRILYKKIRLLENFINTSKILYGANITYDTQNKKLNINSKEFTFSHLQSFRLGMNLEKHVQESFSIEVDDVVYSLINSERFDKKKNLTKHLVFAVTLQLSEDITRILILFEHGKKENIELLVKVGNIEITYNLNKNKSIIQYGENHEITPDNPGMKFIINTEPFNHELKFYTDHAKKTLNINFDNLHLKTNNNFAIDDIKMTETNKTVNI